MSWEISHLSDWQKSKSEYMLCWWACGEAGALKHCWWKHRTAWCLWRKIWEREEKLHMYLFTYWPSIWKATRKKKHKMTMCKIIHRSVISDRKKWENESNVYLIEDQWNELWCIFQNNTVQHKKRIGNSVNCNNETSRISRGKNVAVCTVQPLG